MAIKKRLGSLLGPQGIPGEEGKTPVFIEGQTTTVGPHESAKVELTQTGDTEYRVDAQVPRGLDGDPAVPDKIVEAVESGALGRVHHVLIEDHEIISVPDESVSTLILEQAGTGGHTIGWPSEIMWDQGVSPEIGTLPGEVDMVTFIRAGGRIYGVHAGRFMVPGETPQVTLYSYSDTTALIEWEPISGAFGYEVRADHGPAVSTIDLYHQVGGLDPGTEHLIQVRAEIPDGYTGWSDLQVTTKTELESVFFDDFDAPDGTSLEGRTVDNVTLSSPGIDLTWVVPSEAIIQDGMLATTVEEQGAFGFSWPVTSQYMRVSADYTITTGGGGPMLALSVGESRSSSFVSRVFANGRWVFRVNASDVLEAGPTFQSGRATLQVEGKYITQLIDGEVLMVTDAGVQNHEYAAISLRRGPITCDNVEVENL